MIPRQHDCRIFLFLRCQAIAAIAVLGTLTALPCNAGVFEIIALPDTQYYSADWYDLGLWSYPLGTLSSIFKAQTQWIKDNQTSENIAFVTHLGDVVDFYWEEYQWENARNAMQKLKETNLPYSVCRGNHDWGIHDEDDFARWFGKAHYEGETWYPERARVPSTGEWVYNGLSDINHWQVFSAGGQTYLHVNLSYGPDLNLPELEWAGKVLEAYKGVPTIISTHDYLTTNGIENDGRSTYGQNVWKGDQEDDQKVWKGIENIPQVFMVLCGHVYDSDTRSPGARREVSYNASGKPVLQVLSDYQVLPAPNDHYYGGAGYLRQIVFDEGAHGRGTLAFETFTPTPTFPDWSTPQYMTGEQHEFAFPVTFGKDGVRITTTGIVNGGFECGRLTGWERWQPSSFEPSVEKGSAFEGDKFASVRALMPGGCPGYSKSELTQQFEASGGETLSLALCGSFSLYEIPGDVVAGYAFIDVSLDRWPLARWDYPGPYPGSLAIPWQEVRTHCVTAGAHVLSITAFISASLGEEPPFEDWWKLGGGEVVAGIDAIELYKPLLNSSFEDGDLMWWTTSKSEVPGESSCSELCLPICNRAHAY